MLEFSHSSTIAASVATVWRFYARPDAPELLIPPWQPVTIVRKAGSLGSGAEIEYRLQIGPVPVRWVLRQTACLPERLFVEETLEGPVESWVLRHELEPLGPERARLIDEISYQLRGGPIAESLLAPWVTARLQDMFAYRHNVIRQACEPLQQFSLQPQQPAPSTTTLVPEGDASRARF